MSALVNYDIITSNQIKILMTSEFLMIASKILIANESLMTANFSIYLIINNRFLLIFPFLILDILKILDILCEQHKQILNK